ncbi:MAG: DUF1501 domain-containing protein [Verrucomicrobia bacterium]|nr:DUF1501 domain-containing protein [Verrucomicrobiota bacterium]
MNPHDTLSQLLTRRHFFGRTAKGIGSAALASLLQPAATALGSTDTPAGLAPVLHRRPKAKRVIYLFQSGAPSHLDLFDPKPRLIQMNGKPMPESLTKGQRIAQLMGQPLNCVGSKFQFDRHGQCGTEISDLLPHIGSVADEFTLIRSMHTEAINHDPGVTLMQTGHQQAGRPAMGSWISYGLGSENDQLPAFVVLASGFGQDQPLLTRYWGSGFLPSSHQGVEFRSSGEPILFVNNPQGITPEIRRRLIDGTRDLNNEHLRTVGDPEIATRIASFEMAFRMQSSVPELTDISREPRSILEMYGAEPGKPSFANNCLLARRLAERGVRFIQLYHRGWDHHNNLPADIAKTAKAVDQPSAALIRDLKQRGLLEDTLVIWGGEFGRTPMNQGDMANGNYGRDHHMKAFSLWMAGGGVRGGMTYGTTDDFGYNTAENPVHVNDFQATLLHLLGIEHTRFTYRFQGRDYRLTDIGGEVIHPILA